MASDGAARLPERLAGSLSDLLDRPRWLVAFSGGLDSTVLLHLLCQQLRGRAAPQLLALHVHHGLSPAADQWQAHCEAVCRQWSVSLRCASIQLPERPPGGLEAAAREARYSALARWQQPGDVLLLGHHRDDQAETIALRLLRSTGVAGLAGMAMRSSHPAGLRVRPLLEQPREVLRAYAVQHALCWIEDESNGDWRFSRNFVRHRLLPVLQEQWPEAPAQLLALGRSAADSDALLREVADVDLLAAAGCDRWGDFLRGAALGQYSAPRLRNAVNAWLHRLGQPALRQRQWGGLSRLVQGDAPGVDLSGGSLRRHRGRLYFVPRERPLGLAAPREWDLGEALRLGDGRLAAGPGRGPALRPGRYRVCLRQGGERLQRPGQPREQRLQVCLQEAGVPPWWRDHLPLLFQGGRLAAVADLWVAEGFVVASDAGQTLSWCPRAAWPGVPDQGGG